jgi:polysaccharide biosynthesis/export protein
MLHRLTLSIIISALFFSIVVGQNGTQVTNGAPGKSASGSAPEQGSDDRYLIGTRDVLSIQVYRHPDLTQTVPVLPNGTIILNRLDEPLIALCKSERELADEIAKAYKRVYIKNPQVIVTADQRSQSISVLGFVPKPGSFYINRKIHLLEALAMAGGPNEDAGTRLLVARTGNSAGCGKVGAGSDDDPVPVFGLKIRDVQEGKATFWMEPGDVVTVLDADTVYVYGNVNRQGLVKVREPITLTQAIVSAEGLKPAAKKEKVRVLRQKPGSADREELVFDLNKIDKGRAKDPFLEPNDIVAVSEDKVRSILQGIGSAVRSTIPNTIYRIP